MARRGNRPALYELSQARLGRDRKQDPANSPRRPEKQEPDEAPRGGGSGWFEAGTGVRVPVGFLVLAGVILVLATVAAWRVGYARGARHTEAIMAATPQGAPVDPLLLPAHGTGDVAQPRPEPLVLDPPTNSTADKPWHFVLAETHLDGARRLEAFCRDSGLDVMVILRHNTGLARVVALPGLATSSRQAAEARALEERIAAIGRRWKHHGGRTDFSDRYIDRISPTVGQS